MYLVLVFVWILESYLNIFYLFFGFCSFKFFLYFLGCCVDPQGLSLSLSIYLAASANLCCHPAERKKMAIGKLVGVHITTFTRSFLFSPSRLVLCCYNFGLGLGLVLDFFYSNCLDVRLYFCQFLFWCSFMWFLFAAFWRALFVDVHWLALNCLELQPCLPQLGSPFFSLLTKKIWPCPCLPLEIPKQNVYTRKKRCMDISSTITGWDKVLIRELFNIPCGLTWILDL